MRVTRAFTAITPYLDDNAALTLRRATLDRSMVRRDGAARSATLAPRLAPFTPTRQVAHAAPGAVYASSPSGYNFAHGDVAQLGERRVRNAEVVSSILIVSTTNGL